MTNIAPMSGMASAPGFIADGSGSRLAEQVGIEVERLSGTLKDGVEAAETASKDYRGLLADAYARMLRVSMRSGTDMGNHMLALMQVRTPADLLALNFAFVQSQVSSMQDRFFEVIGVERAAMPDGKGSEGKGPATGSETMTAAPFEPQRGKTWTDGHGAHMMQS